MERRIVPVLGCAYTRMFFMLNTAETDLSAQPHLSLPAASEAQFALEAGDDGLEGLGIACGDYLLFGTTAPLRAAGQVVLVRDGDESIVREAYWDGDATLLRLPGERYEALRLPTENIRIAAVLDNAVKRDGAHIVRFK